MANQGKLLAVGIVVVALAAASFGWWWNFDVTRRCREFWGPAAAVRIATAPAGEVLVLGQPYEASPETEVVSFDGQRYALSQRYDVSQSRGFGNVRRLLVQDRSFDWSATSVPAPRHWEFAFRFDDGTEASVVLLALPPRLAALAGQAGRVVLNEGAARVLADFIAEQVASDEAGRPAK